MSKGEFVTQTRPGPWEHLPACNDQCEADRHYMATDDDEFRRLTPDELKERGRWHLDDDTVED